MGCGWGTRHFGLREYPKCTSVESWVTWGGWGDWTGMPGLLTSSLARNTAIRRRRANETIMIEAGPPPPPASAWCRCLLPGAAGRAQTDVALGNGGDRKSERGTNRKEQPLLDCGLRFTISGARFSKCSNATLLRRSFLEVEDKRRCQKEATPRPSGGPGRPHLYFELIKDLKTA